ncbi:hypothetical protein [Aeromicrobium chenweiae]|uniref:hypothetical protein n=1 Tax=Aeromicrobium chenweiae TaxID=2079793 RepID=UPI0010927CA8|nr:hypothetical protein [Aeromicrobium chenweiae]TGN31796.1 hypothetical protein E4L97_12535 [Aeromicrobium chenweiae]
MAVSSAMRAAMSSRICSTLVRTASPSTSWRPATQWSAVRTMSAGNPRSNIERMVCATSTASSA